MTDSRATGKLTLPKFGSVQDRMRSFSRHGFGVETYECRRAYDQGRYQELRILHVSTYLDGVWPEIRKITQYLNNDGFLTAHKRYLGREFHQDCVSSDVLLLGCDSNEIERVRNVLLEIERGMLGVWRWDILWYFADGRVPPDARSDVRVDKCSNDEFSADAISMIRTHIDRRYDSTAQAGLPVKLAEGLEKSIDRIIRPIGRYNSLGKRLTRLEKRATKLKGCRDWDLFITAASFLASGRDYYTHRNQSSAMDNMLKEWGKFKKAVQNHGFVLPPVQHEGPVVSGREDNHSRLKLLTVLGGMAKAWLDECDKSIWK